MPSKPQIVKASGKPAQQPSDFTAGTFAFPERLASLARERQWSRDDLRRIAGVNQGTVSKWLRYKSAQPDRTAILLIEEEAGLPGGHLTREPETGTTSTPSIVISQLKEWAGRIGLHESIVATFRDEERGAMIQQFALEIQQAIIGLVHVHGVSIEDAVAVAKRVVAENTGAIGNPLADSAWWFTQLVLRKPARKASGTHYAVQPARRRK